MNKMNISLLTREFLIEEYINKGKSQKRIAKEIGVSEPTVMRRLKKFSIERRRYSHSIRDNHVKLTKPLLDLIEGELLGDGHISMIRPYRAGRYSHSSKHEGYIEWLFGEFEKYGLKQSGKIQRREGVGGFGYGISYSASTKYYVELKNLRFKWYPLGKKVIPYDLEITPVILRQWFLGDGHYAKKPKQVSFSTRSLPLIDVKHLVKLIKEQVKINPTIPRETAYGEGKGYSIFIPKRDVYDFFNYIGECPDGIKDFFGYKFPPRTEMKQLLEYKEKEDLADKTYRNKDWLLECWNKGWSREKIAKTCGVTKQTITYNFRTTGAKTEQMSFRDKYRFAPFKNKDWLKGQLQNKSERQIAKECNVSHTTIQYWIRKNKL